MSEKLLEFRWGTSRGVDTAGYTLCTLWVNGRRVARECGGGYDMKGAALGNFIARAYAYRLVALTLDDYPELAQWQKDRGEARKLSGLRFYDPGFNPSAVTVTADMVDGCFIKAGDVGKPLSESGDVGLMTLRAAYKNSSPIPTARHVVPCIDGACGVSSVEKIMAAVGLSLRFVSSRAKCETYLLADAKGGA